MLASATRLWGKQGRLRNKGKGTEKGTTIAKKQKGGIQRVKKPGGASVWICSVVLFEKLILSNFFKVSPTYMMTHHLHHEW